MFFTALAGIDNVYFVLAARGFLGLKMTDLLPISAVPFTLPDEVVRAIPSNVSPLYKA